MFYPENFPKNLEKILVKFLQQLERELKLKKRPDSEDFNRLIFSLLKKGHLKESTKKLPPFWWLNFLLIRHRKNFSSQFTEQLKKFLIKTKTRSLSGVVTVSVFTKPVGCPYHCLYCPSEPSMPKSYFSDEPAVMRAIRKKFDPFLQTEARLLMLALSNHPIDKAEVIIKGGTFSSYSRKYREQFVKRIFDACNTDINFLIEKGKRKIKEAKGLAQAQKINQKAQSRIVGINIETRPDLINEGEIKFLRKLGVTHVEIGVEVLDDKILSFCQRGHDVAAVRKATFLLKEVGFKVCYHLMTNLPGTTPQKDLNLLAKAFTPDYSPDYLKLYPTVITKHSQLEGLAKWGKYQPYPIDELIRMLTQFKTKIVPCWVRIGRLARDITVKNIEGEKIPSNLREIVQKEIKKIKKQCFCIRCREIKDRKISGKTMLEIFSYKASKGKEFFLQFVDEKDHLLGFLRLRIPAYILDKKVKPVLPILKDAALIRELHVYGQLTSIGTKENNIQHQGLGRKLMETAEEIVKKANIRKLAVISGIGVREYYQKFGYRPQNTYMIKDLFAIIPPR